MTSQFLYKRRQFISLLGAAAAWPLAARAQQGERMRRVGVLMGLAEHDRDTKARVAGFRQGLERHGWSEGHNVRIDYRFVSASAPAPVLAKELVALHPDVILANSTTVTAALHRETRTIPIVFTGVTADPIAEGFITGLARPGGNITGLTRPAAGMVSAFPRTRRPRSSTSSTRKSMPPSLIPRSRRDLPPWA
jgi:putative tryptophan/tyrosine transport system substrate-binding protein